MYFLDGLSFRNAVKALYFLYLVKISHVSIWNRIQKYKSNKILSKKKKNVDEYFCIQKDEMAVKAGSELIWLDWVAIIEPTKDTEILSFNISKE